MPSEFDLLDAEMLAPAVMEEFGERDGAGEFKPLQYRDFRVAGGAGDPLLFTGISSAVRSTVEPDAVNGGVVRHDTKTWEIPREQLDAKGITYPHRKARIHDHDSGQEFDWLVDVSQCVWGSVFVTLALMREPLTAGNEVRRANV